MPDPLKIVFMGTPDFAVESLKALLNTKHKIAGVVTSPDKPFGRGKLLESSAVKKFATEFGLQNLMQPESLKSDDFINQLAALNADLFVVVAFRMLPEVVWSMPKKGTVNLHASLLPDYRGAAPINWVIINGEKKTGITTFFIEKEIDTGKILHQNEVTITKEMDAGELHDILMTKGAALLVKTIDSIAKGDIQPVPQKAVDSNKKAPKIFKEDCRINWNQNAETIADFIRGLSPYPAAWTELKDNSKSMSAKIFKVTIERKDHSIQPGSILSDGKNFLKIAVADGFVSLTGLQLAGKKRMGIEEFLRGFPSPEKYVFI